MFGQKRIVDNRVFLLGLDKLYRDAMKVHEAGELLACARRVAQALEVIPGTPPVEGYYAESPALTEYFRLMRALQGTHELSKAKVMSLPEFGRLLDVVSSPLFGRPVEEGKLLPTGLDPLSQALEDSFPDWSMASLVERSDVIARKLDDYSLVGLAARTRDAVVLTATRETVVLYARRMILSSPRMSRYVWNVDKDLAEAAARFVKTFNTLFGERLPAPKKRHAKAYWYACKDNQVLGRCVWIGTDDAKQEPVHYHWAVYRDGGLTAHEFWHPQVWTTERYRAVLEDRQGQPQL